MITTKSRITQGRLDDALSDIRQYISDSKDWQLAMKELSAIKDYSMGEERFCTSEAALENCAQLKARFPQSTPENAPRNIEAIADEIRRLQQQDIPDPLSALLPILALAALGIVIYCFFFR